MQTVWTNFRLLLSDLDLHCLLKRLQIVSADNKNIQLFVILALRVNTCEVSVWPGLRSPKSILTLNQNLMWGVQWLSGRVLDSRPKGSWFEPHWCHCIVVLEQDTFILA